MSFLGYIELASVITGLIWIILLTRENIWCWPFGIISSLLSIYLFYEGKLYSEAILYLYYVFIGIYGWYMWGQERKLKIQEWKLIPHLVILGLGILGTLLLGSYFSGTDANRPYHDAASTAFSFLASYMEAQKILSGWIFWIAINAFSIWLYLDRGFQLYAMLMGIYFILSVYGYMNWKKKLRATE